MEIKRIDKEAKSTILALEDDIQIGEITYVKHDDQKIVIDHTEVESFARGRGIAKDLVGEVVSIAREKGWKVVPQCPFAAAEFEKNEEYKDVLA